MAKLVNESVRLVLENGDEIEVTFPLDVAEEMFEEMREAQSRDTFWNVGNWTNARAMYKGFSIGMINMRRVVGVS